MFLRALCDLLGLTTPLLRAEQIPRFADDPTGRLVEICQARGAATYVSGPAAKAYLDRTQFDAIGVGVAFTNYSGYPVYDQGLIPFEHGVSILDLMFRFGPEAHAHLKSPRDPTTFLDLAR